MNSWKVILATMVIFGAGVVTGGLLVGHFEHTPVQPHPSPPAGPRPGQLISPAGMRLDLLRRMVKDLDLTTEQRDRVDKVLKESQDRTRKVMAPFLREELLRATADFREVLTPDQRQRFDDLLKQKQQQRAREQHHGERPDASHPPVNIGLTNQ